VGGWVVCLFYVLIYVYIYREREREREMLGSGSQPKVATSVGLVGIHSFEHVM
jgi:hypothetical protein